MNKKLPLDNINIIDLTKVLSGPFASLILSDLGANVIKVEPPNGDDSRKYGPFINNKSCYFISLNRGKQSMILDLKKKEDKYIFEEMLLKSDVLLENYKPETLKKLGYSWKNLSKKFPKLIYAKISGFGESGSLSKLPAYDIVVQAMSGIMSITGSSKNNFSRVGTSIGDIAAGLYCAIGILSALYNRKTSKIGSKIDISMLDCQIAILENAIARYTVLKDNPIPLGTDHPSITPFGSFKTLDEKIVIAAGNDKIFNKLCDLISRNDLCKNKLFSNNLNRSNNINALRYEIEKSLELKKSKYWIKIFRMSGIPCSKINKISEVLKNPQLIERNMFLDYIESLNHKFKVSGNPIKINGIKESHIARKAPNLNQDKKKILKFFGINLNA